MFSRDTFVDINTERNKENGTGFEQNKTVDSENAFTFVLRIEYADVEFGQFAHDFQILANDDNVHRK
jgi:hypothetical protein